MKCVCGCDRFMHSGGSCWQCNRCSVFREKGERGRIINDG
jgi:hypothetical protein